MGICSSCESTSVATAKLILEDGRLQEFSDPVGVSQVLQRNPGCFICNADDMEFDGFVSAINSDEMLQMGQLYFALPESWLNARLRAEEMAALAVKASLALKMGGHHDHHGCCWCRPRNVNPVELGGKRAEEASPMVMISGHCGGGGGGGYGGGFVVKRRGSKKRTFCGTHLDVILEEEREAINQ